MFLLELQSSSKVNSSLEKSGQGREIAASLDLDKYYCIVIVSGDGLIYEV